jgi:predicted nuclease of restriction endonuclease-like (RecB) superfamily
MKSVIEKNLTDSTMMTSPEYRRFIEDLKARVLSARISAARSVNRDGILLYWDLGRAIVEKQLVLGWGESVIDRVSSDLRAAFPDSRGFSPRNLRDMKRLYLAYTDEAIWRQVVAKMSLQANSDDNEIRRHPVANLGTKARGAIWPQPAAKMNNADVVSFLRQLVAEIPWGQNLLILNKLTDPAARLWYLRATARFGWSRNVLLNQIKASAYEHAVTEKKTHNFDLALPEHFAEQADEMLKSSYSLDFLGLRRAVKERELEDRLISRLQAFLLELGYGFCFVGRQYRIALGKKEYFIDLLFYHRFLKALVAFDLKVGPFEPEHAGKMDFYLNLLNDKERGPEDQTSIGIILCAEKDDVEVEYALRTKANPIGVAVYELQSKLPGELKGKLPSAKQLADVVREEMEGNK